MGLSINLRTDMAESSKGGGRASWVRPSFRKSVQIRAEGGEAVLRGKEGTTAVPDVAGEKPYFYVWSPDF